ncbi:MAG: 2-oxoacid:acceptor oxidoreductase family protein [Holophagae bacterium]|jgi:2-oxoglutarate ferredoxin oxidoreductase subunit gamma
MTDPKRVEIRITGFGGQGVVLSGHIIGRACAVHAGKHATMIQSFGPEARGSACSTTLAVSDTEVLYPYIGRPDIFIVMSAEGYDKYRDELKDDGTLIYEKDLVKPKIKKRQPSFGVSSTRIAEGLGRAIVQNIVMLGFFAAVTGLVPREAMRDAVAESVPKGTEELNLRAFDAGWHAYEEEYGASGKTEEGEEVLAAT